MISTRIIIESDNTDIVELLNRLNIVATHNHFTNSGLNYYEEKSEYDDMIYEITIQKDF